MTDFFKSADGGVTEVQIIGPIDETTDFKTAIEDPDGNVVVNCRGIPRINSVGVKSWITYFKGLTAKGTSVKLVECSPAIVEQINMISNFLAGCEVESILLPYITDSGEELTPCFPVADLKSIYPEIPEVKGEGGEEAQFDDIPEEYFGFLTRD